MTSRVFVLAVLVLAGCKKPAPPADTAFYKKVQAQLIQAKPGEVIELPEGKFQLDRSLSSTVDGITIRGKGMGKTILSFQAQTQGAEGLSLKGNGITLEDFAIEDTKGDGIKVTGANGLTIRRVRTEWTRGPDEKNGSYGIYPVQCQDVLIEDSQAIAASDAGIYVGQSKNVIIRRNVARLNVAGIESENSQFVDVYENQVTENTGGILVFDLPDLPVMGGRSVRVFKNKVTRNNTDNFAPEGNIVGVVPPGTGVMVMANDDVEVFDNDIAEQRTVNLAIVSYFVAQRPIKDARYDPYPEAVHVHHNRFGAGGESPAGLIIKVMALKIGKPFPDIMYDGILDEKKLVEGKLPPQKRVCIHDNAGADFANIDARNDFANIQRDLAPYNCTLPSPQPVALAGTP